MTLLTQTYAIPQMVRHRATELGTQAVFTYQGEQSSFIELDENSNRTANALLSAGIGRSDRIAFLARNTPDYFELIAAAGKIGAVVVPINWRLAGRELTYILNDSGCSCIFVQDEFYEGIAQIQSSLETALVVYLLDAQHDDAINYQQWQQKSSALDPALDHSADDPIVQLYTSGTTGRPKGAVLSSRMLLALRGQEQSDVIEDWQRYEHGESGLLVMPCFHVGGTSFGLGIIYSGAHCVVLPEYDPDQLIDLIEQYRVSKVFMVPAALQSLMNNPKFDSADLSSLKHIYYGASPIPLELMRAAMTQLGCGFVQMYGMTESGGTIVALPPEDHDPNFNDKMNSVGKPLCGVELKIVDSEGVSLAPKNAGEIVTRSCKNIRSYWQLPEATQSTIDKEGWLRTGDVGYLDEEGYLYIHDRIKDMIISGGENIYPAEVENALFGHPQIADVAVIGVPDPKWGESVKAVVVLKSGDTLDEQSLIDFARSQIASYKCPKSVDFMDVLPRNATGKVLRRKLRTPYWKSHSKAVN